jgi:hypothetical protein
MASGLARELRENVGYLRDAGWDSTAKLMERAADELERLDRHVARLEQDTKAPVPDERFSPNWRTAFMRARTWVPPRPHKK